MSNLTRPPDEASLLGLPRELRLQIYEHVPLLDINYTAVVQWRHTHTSPYGFRSFAELNKKEKLELHWLNLMLSCRAIAVELRALMREQPSLDDARARTYVLDLEATRGGMALGAVTWRRIPCAPEQAQYLHAYYNASQGFQAWGNGGPHGIMSGLYQTLNHLIHCGPRFDTRFELQSPVHLKELRIVIERRDVEKDEDENAHYRLPDRHTDPETTMIALGSIVGQINHTGVLRGSVDRIEVVANGKVLCWSSEDSENTGIPEYWNRYGFDWGMDVYRDSKAIP